MSLAVVFPGQGSQRVGMGRDWSVHPAARAVFEEADAALGFPISQLCFEGPEEELKLTANQQPAILTTSCAIFQAIREELPTVTHLAGHSLGEYTALVTAGALSLADAVVTVRERGRLMQEAVPKGRGAMAAVIGLDLEAIRETIEEQAEASLASLFPGEYDFALKSIEVLREDSEAEGAADAMALMGMPASEVTSLIEEVRNEIAEPLDIANYNSPDQIVISGTRTAVSLAWQKLEQRGAKRVVELPVSAPFHSSLMKEAADALKPLLARISFKETQTPVISNFAVTPYPDNPAEYPLLLHAQIFNPVRWTETLAYMSAQGVTHLLEVGPGKVLRLLTTRSSKSISSRNIELERDLPELQEWFAEINRADGEEPA